MTTAADRPLPWPKSTARWVRVWLEWIGLHCVSPIGALHDHWEDFTGEVRTHLARHPEHNVDVSDRTAAVLLATYALTRPVQRALIPGPGGEMGPVMDGMLAALATHVIVTGGERASD